MPQRAVLAIDQGTTNTKALLVAADGKVLGSAAAPVKLRNPRPGWFEQDPEDLWASVLRAVAACLAAGGHPKTAAVAISNQRESVLAWERRGGQPRSPVLGWQDARTADFCRQIADQAAVIRRRTGLALSPMFSAPKLRWLADHAFLDQADLQAGTVDAYLLARITGRGATEPGNASRTLLVDLARADWSEELLGVFGLPARILPGIRPSDAEFGRVLDGLPIPAGTPVRAVLGDSHAALYAHGIGDPGQVKATYGTGSSVMAPLAAPPAELGRVAATIAWQAADQVVYALEGNILATGAALDTMARILGLRDVAALTALAAQAEPSRLSVVPAFAGLGAPHWRPDAIGLVCGLARDTTPAQVAHAAMDCVAQQICDVLDGIGQTGQTGQAGHRVTALAADGGPSANPVLMQLQADLAGVPVAVAGRAELSALGVAKLAWRALGEPADWDLNRRVHEPGRTPEWRAEQRARWADALGRSWTHDPQPPPETQPETQPGTQPQPRTQRQQPQPEWSTP
ncbi:MAG: hypothetical protein LBD77_09800 [Bifidobacteriaceae bacterium]|jgi:glycerol kinase|nr:hypothetical protein [Bifidobacteriaceae bacterium]